MKSISNVAEPQIRWCLEAVAKKSGEWTVTVDSVPFIVGREEDCNLKLIDKWISRHHSEIRKSGEHLWIRDLGSTNGTFVNRKKIKQAELLDSGDVISIGKFEFCVKKIEASSTVAEETCAMDITDQFQNLALLEPKLQALIRDRKVIPHFQPILKFSDKSVVGYEVLGRVADEGLPANPADLLDVAEWLGCGSDLSALFRETGVDQGRNIPGSPQLFVNTTPLEIYQMNVLLESMEKIHNMAVPNNIVLEINEKAAQDTNEMSRLRSSLIDLDIALAFDDFGVGQTRLVELAKVPPDYLKFDISLVRGIHLAPKRLHQMVSTFVRATQDLGISALAEGIECLEEAETCQELGFDLAQGFFYGKPLPLAAINTN